MRPKVLEENIDNFNAVTREAIERMAKMKGTNGEIPDLEEELSRWSTESKGSFTWFSRRKQKCNHLKWFKAWVKG